MVVAAICAPAIDQLLGPLGGPSSIALWFAWRHCSACKGSCSDNIAHGWINTFVGIALNVESENCLVTFFVPVATNCCAWLFQYYVLL
jgi:hypothetical protein